MEEEWGNTRHLCRETIVEFIETRNICAASSTGQLGTPTGDTMSSGRWTSRQTGRVPLFAGQLRALFHCTSVLIKS